jgi:3-oxoacyl-[acyl-carrier protein] reductase
VAELVDATDSKSVVLGRAGSSPARGTIYICYNYKFVKKMDLGIKGKKALVLGASSGLGRDISKKLAYEGCDLVIASRDIIKLELLAIEIRNEAGVRVEPYQVDLQKTEDLTLLCSSLEERMAIDILVNNTGGPPPSTSLNVSDDIWSKYIQSIILSTMKVTESAVKRMKDLSWGRVVTITSSGVVQPIENLSISNTLRPAIVGFMKSLSNEIAQYNITVNTIIPGRILTDRTGIINTAKAKKYNTTYEEMLNKSAQEIPMKRFGSPDEFASVLAFLVSERASYVTGHMMRVDGGLIKSI